MPLRHTLGILASILAVGCLPALLLGQGSQPNGTNPAAPAQQGTQVVIKREAIRLVDPEKYKVVLQLEPHQSVEVAAPFDGIVRQVVLQPNAQTAVQGEAVRLDNTVQRLQLQKAQALLKAAQIELKQANAGKNEDAIALAQARVDAAKAEVDLAQHQLDRTTVRAPLAGQVLRVHVVDGQYVRAGQPLMRIANSSRLKVEVPAERSAVEVGKPLKLQVEGATLEGQVEAVLPLNERFSNLRELFESVVSAVVILENADGKLKAGQTVYVPLIPRQPVTEVPAGAIANTDDGQRRVQVIREGVVRELPVVLMGPVGPERLFVSGAFAQSDEVIYESSQPLADGTRIQPSVVATATPTPTTTPATQPSSTEPTRPANKGF